jgi:UDP-N-acetylglucosamine--N-acetylmuramyl-(pentapeptide) pyrophosphoryl-undecaprenol N-acetylglucosamine transferase
MKKKIILTGGGTAGHITPILAICEVLKRNHQVEFLYVGGRNNLEKDLAEKNNLPFKGIVTGKCRNYFSFSNFIDFFKVIIGIIQSFFLILSYKPNIIFAKGGYVAFPLVFTAKIFKIPLVIHESDTIMGKSNRYAISYARKICLGFPVKYYRDLPIEKTIYTGTPVVKAFFTDYKEKNSRPTILITGGSQGSEKLNNIITEILPELSENYEIYHLTGEKNIEEQRKKFVNEKYHSLGFTDQMAELMKKADLIISRAGANTLAEISAQGKAVILVPLPSSHLNHQEINANIYEEANAAVNLSESHLTSSSLGSIINRLMEDDKLRGLLGESAKQFSRNDSVQEIIDILFANMK